MELFKFLIKEAPLKSFSIMMLALTAGVMGGSIAPVVMTITEKIADQQPHGRMTLSLPVIALFFIFSKRLSQFQVAAVTEQALERLLNRIADTLRRQELAQFETLNRSDMYLSMANAQTITNAATKSIDVFQNLITIMVCWGYLFHLSAQAGLVFSLAFSLIVVILEVFQALMKPLAHEERETETRLFGSLRHLLDGFQEIKLDRRKNDDLYEHDLAPLATTTKTIRTRLLFYFSEYTLFITSCLYLIMGINMFFLSLVYPSEIIIKLLTITLYISTPAFIIYDAFPYLTQGKAALERLLHAAEKIHPENTPEKSLYQLDREEGRAFRTISLENVVFTYHENHDVSGFSIGPITLNLRQGEIVFLTGGNGSGKSTLVKVLTGLYRPNSGLIYLNGLPVNMANHRAIFSAVFTDFHLFDRVYGTDPPESQHINRLLTQMELVGKTTWQDDRFRSLMLSSGQQKRLALIVALLEEKPVYVFDEWAADQDPHFRRYFYEELLPALKMQNKTIFAVTHDDAYFHLADRLITMEYGKILEDTRS